jgi:hypothetical protein
MRTDNIRVAELEGVLKIGKAVGLVGQVQSTGALPGLLGAIENPLGLQQVFAGLGVRAAVGGERGVGSGEGLAEDARVCGRVRGIDGAEEVLVLSLPVLRGEEVGGGLGDGSGDVRGRGVKLVIGLDGGEGVGGVECRVQVGGADVATQLYGSGFGDDVDSSIADAVVLGGEGVLVDPYLEDGRLRRELAARVAIDVELSAIGTGGGACESLKLRLQRVGIIG